MAMMKVDPATGELIKMAEQETLVVMVRTPEDMRKLSYYTLCKLQESTHYANPILGLPVAIERGEYRGRLTTDHLGNYLAFE